MTRGEAKTLLKRYGFDDTDPLNNWLDSAVVEFENSRDWPFLQQVYTVTGSIGDSTIALPAALFKVHTVRDMTNKAKLQYVDITQFEREVEDPTQDGAPEIYTITGTETIRFWPVADLAIDWRVVYEEELVLPSQLGSDATQMPGPARCHYTYVRGAAFIALQAENEEERAQTAQAQFEADIDKHWYKYATVQRDEPRQVVDAMGYGP